jgi:hypothetical protein
LAFGDLNGDIEGQTTHRLQTSLDIGFRHVTSLG